jgi:cbb3-type cytochrome oxidase maturation protein
MSVLVFLVPAAIFLGALGLFAFFWCMRTEQFDDPEGAARRILDDDR